MTAQLRLVDNFTVSTEHVSAFIAALTDCDLEDIYWNGARLWLDTGRGAMLITFASPLSGHTQVPLATPWGTWVWTELGCFTADDHPLDDEGGRLARPR